MVVAVIVGVLVGLVSIIPFYFAAKNARKIDPTSGSMALLAPFLLTIAISLVILLAGLIVAKLAVPDLALMFAAGEFVAFVVGVIVFGIYLSKRR